MVPEEAAQEYTVEGEVVSETGTTVDEEGNTDREEDSVQEVQNDEDIEQEDTKENITSDTALLGSKSHSNVKENDYKCSECQAEFVRASQLRAHERTHYEEQVRLSCRISLYSHPSQLPLSLVSLNVPPLPSICPVTSTVPSSTPTFLYLGSSMLVMLNMLLEVYLGI